MAKFMPARAIVIAGLLLTTVLGTGIGTASASAGLPDRALTGVAVRLPSAPCTPNGPVFHCLPSFLAAVCIQTGGDREFCEWMYGHGGR